MSSPSLQCSWDSTEEREAYSASTYLLRKAPRLPYVPAPLFLYADLLLKGHVADYQLSKVAVAEKVTKQGPEVSSWFGTLDC